MHTYVHLAWWVHDWMFSVQIEINYNQRSNSSIFIDMW